VNDLQKQRIRNLRQQGNSYAKVAATLGLNANSVKSYCQRNSIGAKPEPDRDDFCRNCGVELVQTQGHKRRRFCSAECRIMWWKANPCQTEKATYHFTCSASGTGFTAYGNKGRKYCNHACYVTARFKVAA